MDEHAAELGPSGRSTRFEFGPPRRFLLPAILLLLSERPGYGYMLVKDLQAFRFGRVDRPSVYRALAQLEADGLVQSWSEPPKAGQRRRVYGITERGEQRLRVWMGVINEERDRLDRVLHRYQATGSVEAAIAEVEGGWAAALRSELSPVSPTTPLHRRLRSARPTRAVTVVDSKTSSDGGEPLPRQAALSRFRVEPDRSVVLIEARSSVGPISFGAIGVTGEIEAAVGEAGIVGAPRPAARLEILVEGLRSGNNLYDAELLRRIDARRYPVATIELRQSTAIGADGRHRLTGELSFHGVTRLTHGTVRATVDDSRLVVTGEQTFDIRDFDIACPTVLMLRIYPDVRVHLHVEAVRTS